MGMQRTSEDFGQTLGVWGVDSGPFIVLPFLGPTNPRDIVGRGADAALNPLNYPEFENDEATRLGIVALGGISAREGAIETFDELRQQIDPYTTLRRLYGRTRASDIGIPHDEPNDAPDLTDDELDF
jgi:phospholipid-binding lipoprotein MlaA